MSKEKTRVLIVSDHPIMRAGLRLAIERQSDMQVAGEATDRFAAVNSVLEIRPHLILIDLPELERDFALKWLAEFAPSLPTVVLTDEDALATDSKAFKGNALVVLKSSSGDSILDFVRTMRRTT